VLSYDKDSFYIRHADDSSEVIDNNGNAIDYKLIAPHRVVTTLLFLNSSEDDFCGGDLVFSHLSDINGVPFHYKPKQGFMLIFPSNPYFAHEVLNVTSGHRATLVNWHDAIVH
jgi:SM-20-related protein